MIRTSRAASVLVATALATAGLAGLSSGTAQAAGETVNIVLTTTDDSGGRHVTRGLQAQTPASFGAGNGGSGTNITVDENTRYQTFTGGGASFTDTAAWLMKGSGALSQATRDETMKKLFSPTEGIGLSFVRNPMGGSTWRGSVTRTTTCRPGRPTPASRSSRSHTISRTSCRSPSRPGSSTRR